MVKRDVPGVEELAAQSMVGAVDSKLHVWVIPTNEEYMIALDVKELLGK